MSMRVASAAGRTAWAAEQMAEALSVGQQPVPAAAGPGGPMPGPAPGARPASQSPAPGTPPEGPQKVPGGPQPGNRGQVQSIGLGPGRPDTQNPIMGGLAQAKGFLRGGRVRS